MKKTDSPLSAENRRYSVDWGIAALVILIVALLLFLTSEWWEPHHFNR
jgi:hypothetical protein